MAIYQYPCVASIVSVSPYTRSTPDSITWREEDPRLLHSLLLLLPITLFDSPLLDF